MDNNSTSSTKRNNKKVAPGRPDGLGTFGGVFTPSILTILGVIMYLRFGWVVGNVGLIGTLVIVTISTSITFLTSLSIASIATDQQIKIGGAYYMISRSLGIETGGSVGIPLFLAQALSVALYVIGFAESLTEVFPGLNGKVVGCVVTVAVGLLAMFSTQATIKTQYFILAAIAISLISLIAGQPLDTTTTSDTTAITEAIPDLEKESFWVVLAVFFPAVTGIMAGVNLSGDLRNPSQSIPKGTFYAVGVGYLIYMMLPIILATRADAATLIEDPLIMRRISFWGNGILLGVWGATLSSAVGSILGAPRILQALVKDQVLPRQFNWLGKGVGKDNIPRAGTMLTMAIGLLAVLLGNLDIIAPILTMFFLTTYGVLNVAAGIERLLGSPSFRPNFKVHWSLSFLGALGCIAIMFLINALATLIAILFVSIIYVWLTRRGLRSAWGDVRRGLWMALTSTALRRLDYNPDPKNWRPHVLVLSGAPTRRWHLIELANALTRGQSLLSVATVVTSEVGYERIQTLETNLREFLQGKGIQAFVRVIPNADPFSGGVQLVNTYGLGALVPNTVMLGDTQEAENHAAYSEMIRHFHRAQRNVIIVRDDAERGFGRQQRIDVWWGGLNKNGGLMMILAHMLQNNSEWQKAIVTIKMMVPTEAAAEGTRANLYNMISTMRVDFRQKIIVSDERPFWEVLRQESAKADLIMLGLAEPDDDFQAYYENLSERTQDLPTTVFILAAQEIDFRDILL